MSAGIDIDAYAREAEMAAEAALRALAARERDVRLLCAELDGRHADFADAAAALARGLRGLTCCEAVGVRLRSPGGDYPYIAAEGFDADFVRKESSLVQRPCADDRCPGMCGNAHRHLILGEDPPAHVTSTYVTMPALTHQPAEKLPAPSVGPSTPPADPGPAAPARPTLDCMCGNVIRGLFDPALGTFTRRGTFVCNDLRSADLSRLHFGCPLRGVCALVGFRTMAIAPVRVAGEGVGLVQCNSREPGRMTAEALAALEMVAASIGVALSRSLRHRRLPSALAGSLGHLAAPAGAPCDALRAPCGPTAAVPGAGAGDIEDVLAGLGIERYAEAFRSRSIDCAAQLAAAPAEQLAAAVGLGAVSACKVVAEMERRAVRALRIEGVELRARIGQGEFGTVWEALWEGTRVAAKQVRGGAQWAALVHEAAVLSRLSHAHVLRLCGLAYTGDGVPAPALVTELAAGSLLDLLRSGSVPATSPLLLRLAEDAASGLAYLAAHGVIHRDLACRNLLYTRDGGRVVVKIADFGLAQVLGDGGCGRLGGKLPVRWAAIESFTMGACTLASDAWSFGVVLWEIWSLGAVPYEGLQNPDIPAHLVAGNRLRVPLLCPEPVGAMMQALWSEDPQARPWASDVHSKLSELVRASERPAAGAAVRARARSQAPEAEPARERRRRRCYIS
eukprot:m51a1_g9766 putative camp-dependent protein kinase catalytic (677) ;mRNA; f:1647660-1650225